MKARTPFLALLALGALLALAPATQAATPFTAGTGNGHDLAVGSDGTGHVVWNIDEAEDQVGYCRIPAGGTACDSESTSLAFPGASPSASSSGDHAQVFTSRAEQGRHPRLLYPVPDGRQQQQHLPLHLHEQRSGLRGPGPGRGPRAEWPVGLHQHEQRGALRARRDLPRSEQPAIQRLTSPLGSSPTYVYNASVVAGPSATKAVYAVNDLHTVWYRVFTDPVAPVTVPDLNTRRQLEWKPAPSARG